MALLVQIGSERFSLAAFSGHEALSQLFSYQLDLLADSDREVRLDALVGRSATLELPLHDGSVRTFNGIVSRISQGARGTRTTQYRAEVVPQLWLLTRRQQSRIFQNKSVPDIVRTMLDGLVSVELRLPGTYPQREYCVQYRETDFNFVSRLMEEEGIFYFFRHTSGGHTLVLADSPEAHPDVPGSRAVAFDPSGAGKDAAQSIFAWEKTQELRSGKVTLWDHNFQLPGDHLEGAAQIREFVQVGQVQHGLRVGGNAAFELYDYPGRYASHFDGIGRRGGEQPAELQKIFAAAQRTAAVRMDEEAVRSITIAGSSNSGRLASGHRFTLSGHSNGDGPYVLTAVHHRARINDSQEGAKGVQYENDFTCIPYALPFRPPRVTPKPTAPGTDTGIVVTPAGEQIFTDKYGRVKVQFHWDRQGQHDENSSCWIRVAQPFSGSDRGAFWIPEKDDEVLVAFEHGDPDRPYVIGALWNPQNMPPTEPQ